MWDRWVQTANGQHFADAVGYKEPPMTVDQSVNGVLAQVCPSRACFLKPFFHNRN